jgi:hypothetical protein
MLGASVSSSIQESSEPVLYCALCGCPKGGHSSGLMGTKSLRCPKGEGYHPLNTFKRYAQCEVDITYNSDPTVGTRCGSSYGEFRPEFGIVICDACMDHRHPEVWGTR